MIAFILILVALLFILGFTIFKDLENENHWALLFDGIFVGWVTIILMVVVCSAVDSHSHPEGLVHPIDVYRGNTELRINGHVQDSTFVVEDSTVVFTEEYLRKRVK